MPRITTKGQVTVPKDIRELLGVTPGDQVEFTVTESRQVLVSRAISPSTFARYEGFLSRLAGRDPDQIVEEMRGESA